MHGGGKVQQKKAKTGGLQGLHTEGGRLQLALKNNEGGEEKKKEKKEKKGKAILGTEQGQEIKVKRRRCREKCRSEQSGSRGGEVSTDAQEGQPEIRPRKLLMLRRSRKTSTAEKEKGYTGTF